MIVIKIENLKKKKIQKEKERKKARETKKNRLFRRYERDSGKVYTVRKPRVADEKGKHQTRTKTRVRLTAVRTRELILRGAPSRGAARRGARHPPGATAAAAIAFSQTTMNYYK